MIISILNLLLGVKRFTGANGAYLKIPNHDPNAPSVMDDLPTRTLWPHEQGEM